MKRLHRRFKAVGKEPSRAQLPLSEVALVNSVSDVKKKNKRPRGPSCNRLARRDCVHSGGIRVLGVIRLLLVLRCHPRVQVVSVMN